MSYPGTGLAAHDIQEWDGEKWTLTKKPGSQAQSISGSGTWNGIADIILVSGTGTKTITLPEPSEVPRRVTIVDAAGNANTHPIIVDPDSTGTIDGVSTCTLNTPYASGTFDFTSTTGAGSWITNAGKRVPALRVIPGAVHESLSTYNTGAVLESRWLHKTGRRGIYLNDYMERAGNDVADAIELALTENPTARCLYLPEGDLVLTRQVGDFLGGDGLRSNLAFIGVPGSTRFIRATGNNMQAMFAFPTSTEKVTWLDVEFFLEDTSVAGCKAIQAYDVRRWRIVACAFITDDVPDNQGNGIALGLFGSTDVLVTECYFDHGQCGLGGLGYGVNGATFVNNLCVNVHDFAVSAVTGPPEETPLVIRNVVIANNTIRGINGTGAIFVGSDGGSFPADIMRGVVVANNTIVGGIQDGSYVGTRTLIVVCSAVVTSNVSVLNNIVEDDLNTSGTGSYGIFISTCIGATSFKGLRVAGNQIGELGDGGGVNGIYCDTTLLDDSEFYDNTLRGNRGMLVANCVRTKIARNRIFDATSAALTITATTRNVTELDLDDNYVQTVAAFANAITLQITGSHTMSGWLNNNKMSSATGSALVFVPGSGSGSFYQTDQKFLSGAQNADMTAATIFNRDPS